MPKSRESTYMHMCMSSLEMPESRESTYMHMHACTPEQGEQGGRLRQELMAALVLVCT